MKKSKALAIALCATVMTGLYAMDVQAVTDEEFNELVNRVDELAKPERVLHEYGDGDPDGWRATWRENLRCIDYEAYLDKYYSQIKVGNDIKKEPQVYLEASYKGEVDKITKKREYTRSVVEMDEDSLILEHESEVPGEGGPKTGKIVIDGYKVSISSFSDGFGTLGIMKPKDFELRLFAKDKGYYKTISLVGLDTRVGNLEDVVKAGGVGGATPDLSGITDRLTSLETNDTKQDGRLNKLEAGGVASDSFHQEFGAGTATEPKSVLDLKKEGLAASYDNGTDKSTLDLNKEGFATSYEKGGDVYKMNLGQEEGSSIGSAGFFTGLKNPEGGYLASGLLAVNNGGVSAVSKDDMVNRKSELFVTSGQGISGAVTDGTNELKASLKADSLTLTKSAAGAVATTTFTGDDVKILDKDGKEVNSMSGLKARLDALDVVGGDVAGLQTAVTSQGTRLDTAEGKITALETNDETQNGRLGAVEAKNTEQDTRLTAVESKNTEQDTRLTAVESKNTEQDTRLTAVESKNTEQDSRLTTLEAGNKAVTEAITGITYDKTKDLTTVDNNLQVKGDLIGTNATITGNLTVGGIADVEQAINANAKAVVAEKDRAILAETALGTRIDNEIDRATKAETALGGRIDNEINRATKAETALGGRIDGEINRAVAAEKVLTDDLAAEVKRSTDEDIRLDGALKAEAARAVAAEKVLTDDLAAEVKRSTDEDIRLDGALTAEVDRAKAAEKVLTDDLAAEVKRSTDEDIRLDGALTAEVDRAKAAEKVLTDDLAAEVKRSTDEDIRLDGALKAEIKRSTDEDVRLDNALKTETSERIAADVALNNRVTRLDGKVDKVGAGAAALAGLHPMEYDPEDKLTFATGIGNYGSETAAALGLFYRPNEKVMFSASSTLGNNENMVNMGLSFALDRTDNTYHTSKKAMAEEIMELRAALAEEQAQNVAQNEQNAEMKAQIQALMQMVRELQQK